MSRLFFFILLFWFASGISQVPIQPDTLSVSPHMTTNIIFPYRIQKADIGSGDVIGQKAGPLDNVLFIKARRKSFSPTNLSVYTSDGKFYSFILRYKEYPDTLNISFVSGQSKSTYPPSLLTDETRDSDAILIAGEKSFLNNHIRTQQIKARLQGIYLKDHLIWFRLEINNASEIDFEPEYSKFFIQYKHSSRRAARQDIEMNPSWQKYKSLIPSQSKDTLTFAFPSFSIDPHKKLIIQIGEKNGERDIRLAVSAKRILHARIAKR